IVNQSEIQSSICNLQSAILFLAMTIVFYISGHGFGHASREVEVVNAIAARRGDVRFIIRSAAPPWLLELSARAGVEIQPFEADTGVAQIDSLRLDEPATARRAAASYA